MPSSCSIPEPVVIDLNPAAQRLTGLQKHEARTMRLEELFDVSGSRHA